MPEDYANKPEIYPHLIIILNAFYQLDSDRNFQDHTKQVKAEGKTANKTIRLPLPISFNSIVKYANIYGYDKDLDDFEEFMFFIRRLDNTYIKFESDKAAR